MTQTVTPRWDRESAVVTDREIAIKAHQAASGQITAEEYFEAVGKLARSMVDQEVARYEAAHPWWRLGR
jgi:hypothetical protein